MKDIILTQEIKVREILPEDNAGTILYKIVTDNPGQTVLLIDEYDYPLTHSLDNRELFEEYRAFLQVFFGAIKDWTGKMRSIFITGVGRLPKLPFFLSLTI